MSDVKLRLRWFPGRYGRNALAEAGPFLLEVHETDGAWSGRGAGVVATAKPTRAEAEAHLEELVRDRLIKALAAFGEEKTP